MFRGRGRGRDRDRGRGRGREVRPLYVFVCRAVTSKAAIRDIVKRYIITNNGDWREKI